MGDSSNGGLDDNAAVELTGKIMVIAIIVLFLVVVIVLFLHLYARWFWWRVEEPPAPAHRRQSRRRRRFVFVPGQEPATRRGLEPSVLRALPVVIFRQDDFKEDLECAVCLSELVDGEKARLLPRCNHGFHVDCIDMWFHSNTTCPLCRNPITGLRVPSPADAISGESIRLSTSSSSSSVEESFQHLNFPTNVLFWGNETQVNSGNAGLEEGTAPSSSGSTSEGMLVIDIPRHGIENGTSSLSPSTSGCVQEELKSPVTMGLRSLKRLLSRDRKSSPTTSGDAEQ